MTAKEKFESEVEEYGAFRVESITNAVVYASMSGGTVFIFCHPDAGYWDKYDCGRPDVTLSIPQVMQAAFLGKEDMPEQVRRTLEDYYGQEAVCQNDILHAVVWLWNNTPAFDDIWGRHGTLHVEYEDDEEPVEPAEYRGHRDFFGEMFLVFRELGRLYVRRFTEHTIAGLDYGAGKEIIETRSAIDWLTGTMLGCDEMLAKNYAVSDPEDLWSPNGAGGSLVLRMEACYWLMNGVVREMDADMERDEDRYSSGAERVQRYIYEFCRKSCSEIERLRTEENADI